MDGGTVLSLDPDQGVWNIVCPTCNTLHRAASRLCPSCTTGKLQELNRRYVAAMDTNQSLRDFITALREGLFKSWHNEATLTEIKNPQLFVEKRWSEFLKTLKQGF